jgi:8-oxo-dGTP pyrophosphatase MutT (NUDIX family)
MTQTMSSRSTFWLGRARRRPTNGLLPKGHIKEGETSEDAALREVREETGASARIRCPIDAVEFRAGKEAVRAKFYLMELVSNGEPLEKRRRGWFSLEDAMKQASHSETKALLRKAADLIATMDQTRTI